MIGSLRGTLFQQSGETVIIDVSGVGYEVLACASLTNAATSSPDDVRCFVYTDVKENSITLYGFSQLLEREVFLLLKKVKGIGSRLALNVLSALEPEIILKGIAQGDMSLLVNVPGIGKRTAERMLVELREQVRQLVLDDSNILSKRIERVRIPSSVDRSLAGTNGAEDTVLALEKLGFSTERARAAVRSSLEIIGKPNAGADAVDPGELLRIALTQL